MGGEKSWLAVEPECVDSVVVSNQSDLFERMLRDAQPPELEAEVEEWIRKLYEGSAGQPSLLNRYWWLRCLFRRAGASEADIDDMMNETVFRYLGPVKSSLWAAAAGHYIRDEETLTPAVRWIAKQLGRPVRQVARECIDEHQHEELLDRFYGIDKLTPEDLEEDWRREQILIEQVHPLAFAGKPVPSAPVDPERLAYESPKAMLKHVAKNILIDYLRKFKTERYAIVDMEDLEHFKDESHDANPEAQVLEQQMHNRYLAAVRELPPLQRAAWILCRDPFLLSDEEAVRLLEPALSGPQATAAVKQRPLSGEDAAQLFGRDVSPDAAKGAKKLERVLCPSALPGRRAVTSLHK